jgi:hypothetical protein
MMKIPLPEYTGGESIDAFLRFLREFLVYLINYNLMGHNADIHRVSLLGASLKDKALRWYQHTIHLNADKLWTFQLAMMELKRHFVKDVSSRDAASRFDQLRQNARTVTELKKELERLSHQMIQPPSEYNMACRFLNALKSEIAGAVVRRGINSENNDLDAIFETAKSVEQGIFYEERQRNDHHATRHKPESSSKPSSKFKTPIKNAQRKTTHKPLMKDGKPWKPEGAVDKPAVICHYCKQKGHYSDSCPKKPAIQRAAAAAPDGLSENDIAFICANAEDEEEEPAEEERSSDSGESQEEEQEDAAKEEHDDDALTLNDWACAARICESSDAEENGEEYIVYNEPFSVNGPGLRDWTSEDASMPAPNVDTGPSCLAAHIVEDDEVAQSSKIEAAQPEQVAYRQRGN